MNKSSISRQAESHRSDSLRRSIESELTREGVSDAPGLAQVLGTDMARIFGYPTTEASPAEARLNDAPRTEAGEPVQSELSAPQRARVCQRLNQSLADCINLQLQCRQARWNIPTQDSVTVRGIFSEIEEAAADYADLLATRISGLDGHPQGTLMVVLERSGLNEYHAPDYRGEADIDAVASALGVIEVSLGHDIQWLLGLGDSPSADLLASIHHVVDSHRRLIEDRQRVHPGGPDV